MTAFLWACFLIGFFSVLLWATFIVLALLARRWGNDEARWTALPSWFVFPVAYFFSLAGGFSGIDLARELPTNHARITVTVIGVLLVGFGAVATVRILWAVFTIN